MRILLADCETDGLSYTKIHCISCKLRGTTSLHRFTDMGEFEEYVKDIKPDKWSFHNGLGFDLYAINDCTGVEIGYKDVIDTSVVSKLVDYKRFNTHSLKEIGEHLKVYKGDYTGGWDVYTEEMGEYCDQDVVVLEAIFDFLSPQIFDPKWAQAMRLEHDIAYLCKTMHDNGFGFDTPRALSLLNQITEEKEELEASFRSAFGTKLVETKRLKYRTKADGTLYANVLRAIEEHPKTTIEGEELVCYEWKEFSPASPKERIDALWDAGWNPHEKTKGHLKKLKEARGR